MAESRTFTFQDVQQHNKDDDAWFVIENKVYDVSKWCERHPGGKQILLFYKGQDATEPFTAFHPDKKVVMKYLPTYCIGELRPEEQSKVPQITKDFRKLRSDLEKEGMFESNKLFYTLHLGHILLMEILAALVCYYYGDSRLGWWITVVLLATSQIQAGWLQHDFGHLSVFTNLKMNELAHKFVIMALKGASMKWWKARHNRHHAKTNVLKKDPDIEVAPLFLFSGMVKANKGWKYTPFQQHYWWILGPPTVTTLLFFFQNAKFVFSKNLKNEIAWGLTFFVRFFLTYTLIAGFWSQLGLYWAMRFLESLWFTWVTSMNHLTMPIEPEDNKDWVNLQMRTTQNVEHSAFNDWFTGHLNFQCEHHLFPTMPRHNYPKVHARVVELCKKHGVPVRVRPLITAFNDILVALSKSSSEWGTSVKKLQ